jgi:Tfp pilus assembly protein PilF
LVDAERPEAHLNLGLLDLRRRELPEAEKEYRTALCLDSDFVPALINVADLDRARGLDDEGEKLLRQAMMLEPDNTDARYSLGLLLVRRHGYAGAVNLLRRAHAGAGQCALRLCLRRRAELDRRARRSKCVARARAPATSDGSGQINGARLDRAGHGGLGRRFAMLGS